MNDGGPAFPCEILAYDYVKDGVRYVGPKEMRGGMSLRDYFAAKAMQSLMLDREFLLRGNGRDVAGSAYEYADAMLAERAK